MGNDRGGTAGRGEGNAFAAGRRARSCKSDRARVGPLPAWPVKLLPAAQLVAAMQADKKTRAGRLRFVLPERVGTVQCGVEAEEEMLVRVLRECAIAAVPLETRKRRRK